MRHLTAAWQKTASRSLYHATTAEAVPSILEQGLVPGINGVVYLVDDPGEARFHAYNMHGNDANVVVLTVDVSGLVLESRRFGETYDKVIPPSRITLP